MSRPRFELTATDGTKHEFAVCAGCGCLVSYTDHHPCHDGQGPR